MKHIIVASGEMASGKGEVARYLHEKYAAQTVQSSHVFRRVLDLLHIPQTRETVSEMSRVLRIGFGEQISIDVILKDIAQSDARITVIEGLRRKEEVEALQASDFVVTVIYLTVGIETRYKRMVARNENDGDAEKSFDEFKANHELNAESTQDEVEAYADHIVDNNGTLEDLHVTLDNIVTALD